MSLVGKTLNQRFYIAKPLAQGGFGHTYLAEDRSFQARHLCVVKHLSPAKENLPYLDKIKELFDREADILAKLSLYSNNLIPKLIDRFQASGELYLVQEFIDGAPLSAELISGKRQRFSCSRLPCPRSTLVLLLFFSLLRVYCPYAIHCLKFMKNDDLRLKSLGIVGLLKSNFNGDNSCH